MYPNDSGSSKSADSVLHEIVLPELTRHLNKKTSDFEVTNDQPAVLKLVSSASVTFWQMTLTVNSLQAFLSEQNNTKEKLQQVMEASSTITAAFKGFHLFNMIANVPIYAKIAKADEEQQVSEYVWTTTDYIITFLVTVVMAIVGTLGLYFCTGRIPESLGALLATFVGCFIVSGLILLAISKIAGPSSSLTISDRQVAVKSISPYLVLVIVLVAAFILAAAAYWFTQVCWVPVAVFLVIVLIYYFIYWAEKKRSKLRSLTFGVNGSIDVQASSQLAVQRYRVTTYPWMVKDYFVTTLVAGLMAMGSTVVIVFCSRLVPGTPRSITLLFLGLVVVFWVVLWAIATLLIEALSSVSSLKSRMVLLGETEFLQITSDATVTVASPLALTLLGLAIAFGLACATAVALYYFLGESLCWSALLTYLTIFLLYYILYWVITLVPWQLQQLINTAIARDLALEGVDIATAESLVATNHFVELYFQLNSNRES